MRNDSTIAQSFVKYNVLVSARTLLLGMFKMQLRCAAQVGSLCTYRVSDAVQHDMTAGTALLVVWLHNVLRYTGLMNVPCPMKSPC